MVYVASSLTGAAANAPAKSPTGRVRRAAGNAFGFCGVLRRGQVERALDADIVDAEELRGGACLFERFGDDQRDRLVIVLNLRTAEQPGRVPAGLLTGRRSSP